MFLVSSRFIDIYDPESSDYRHFLKFPASVVLQILLYYLTHHKWVFSLVYLISLLAPLISLNDKIKLKMYEHVTLELKVNLDESNKA